MRVAVVGAGLAGLACAAALQAAGCAVVVFDKGRAPGGRMSTRRVATALGEATFDHGAQYFTARDTGFRTVVEGWAAAGLAAPWPAAGPEAWAGVPGMNAPVRQMAAALDVRAGVPVERLARDGAGWLVGGEAFDAAVLAVPSENAVPLLQPWAPALAARATATPAAPCWTVMAAYAEPLPFEADVLREDGPIGWAARNSAKPGRSGPEAWVIQAGPDWSRAQLEAEPAMVTTMLLEALARRAGLALPDPVHVAAHRWRYARSGAAGEGLLWDGGLRLGVCGDWLLGPRIEAAWLSGQRLAAAMVGRDGGRAG